MRRSATGVCHAWAFSPLANRLTASVTGTHAADLSGLILTASLIGQALGFAAFVGLYLSFSAAGSALALALTTGALAATLVATSACARAALGGRGQPQHVRDELDAARPARSSAFPETGRRAFASSRPATGTPSRRSDRRLVAAPIELRKRCKTILLRLERARAALRGGARLRQWATANGSPASCWTATDAGGQPTDDRPPVEASSRLVSRGP